MLPHRSHSAPSRSRRLVRLPALLFGAFALLAAGLAHSQTTAFISTTPGGTVLVKTEGETQNYIGTVGNVVVDQTITLRFGVSGTNHTASNDDYAITDGNGNPLSEVVLTFSNTSVSSNQSQTFNFAVEIVDDDLCEFKESISLMVSTTAAVSGSSVSTPSYNFNIDVPANDGGPGACRNPVSPRAGFRAVWESTLTVDDDSRATTTRGCGDFPAAANVNVCSMALTEDEFTLGGTEFTVTDLYYGAGAGQRRLHLWVSGSGALPADSPLRTSDWVLRIGDNTINGVKSFAKTNGSFASNRHSIDWNLTRGPGDSPNFLFWGTGAQLGVRLEIAASTVTTMSALAANGSTDGNNFSSSLTLTPSFSEEQLAYSAFVSPDVTHVQLTPATTHSGASVQVGKPGNLAAVAANADSVAITLTVGTNTILAVVTAEDTSSQQTYTLTVTRAAPSDDSGLRELAVSGAAGANGTYMPQTLTPAFSASNLAYRIEVPNDLTHIKITPTASDSGATIEAGLSSSLSSIAGGTASAAIGLVEGENLVNVKVTASDSTTIRTYTLTVTRREAPSTLELSANPQEIPQSRMSTITATLGAPALSSGATVTFTFNGDAVRGSGADADYDVDTDTITIKGSQLSGEFTITASPNARVDRSIILTASVTTGSLSFSTVQELEITFTAARMERLHEAVLPEVARAVAGRVTGAISARVGAVWRGGGNGASANLGGQNTLAGALQTHAPGLVNDGRPMRDLLDGSDFVLPFHTREEGGGLRNTSLWGSGEYRNFSGDNDGVEFEGSLYGAQIGVDSKVRDNLLAGVALSWSQGELEYEDSGSGRTSQGDYEIDLLAIHPYLSWRSAQMDWWGTVGYGTGEAEITPDEGESSANDVTLQSVSLGGSGLLWSRDDANMRLKGEITRADLSVDRSAQVAAVDVSTTLIRFAAEASSTRPLHNGGHLSPSISLGLRHDGGDGVDGNTSTGAEFHGTMRYANPKTGWNAETSVHALLGRSDYEEWGIQASLRLSPSVGGHGLSFVMRPGYGNGGGDGGNGTERIWSNGLNETTSTTPDPSGRLEMKLGYGLSAPGKRDALLTPWSGLTLHDDGKLYRMGLDWAAGGSSPFTLRLHGERREHGAERADADHAVILKGEARF